MCPYGLILYLLCLSSSLVPYLLYSHLSSLYIILLSVIVYISLSMPCLVSLSSQSLSLFFKFLKVQSILLSLSIFFTLSIYTLPPPSLCIKFSLPLSFFPRSLSPSPPSFFSLSPFLMSIGVSLCQTVVERALQTPGGLCSCQPLDTHTQ